MYITRQNDLVGQAGGNYEAYYTKTDLVFGFLKNQILVVVIPGQKAPRTLLGQNRFRFFPENYFVMCINCFFILLIWFTNV